MSGGTLWLIRQCQAKDRLKIPVNEKIDYS